MAAEEHWAGLRRDLLKALQGQVRVRLASLRRPVAEECERLGAAERVPVEAIRARAYELWERRGQPQGYSERDWTAARAELLARAQPLGFEVQQRLALQEALDRCAGACQAL